VTEIAIPTAAEVRGRVGVLGQATAIEQARAVAEVQAAIVVAQQCPRDVVGATESMREACDQPALAERAFYRYTRAGSAISGESVHLARELARCWGNIQYGVQELSRDDRAGQSEMQAFAWDVQTNTRAAHIFIVPHARDTKGGRKPLVDLREVYENNANAGARRLREAIFAVLPVWFREEAKDRCYKTLQKGGDKPLASRIASAISLYEAKGVRLPQLEAKQGRRKADWTAQDVAQLSVIYTSIDRGEVLISDEFEELAITGADIIGRQPQTQQGPHPSPASREVPAAQSAEEGLTLEPVRPAATSVATSESPGSPGAAEIGVRDHPSSAAADGGGAGSTASPVNEPPPPAPPADDDGDADEDLWGKQITGDQLSTINGLFKELGLSIRDREKKLRVVNQILERPIGSEISSLSQLTVGDAVRVVRELELMKEEGSDEQHAAERAP
jgi:hypothetical protein